MAQLLALIQSQAEPQAQSESNTRIPPSPGTQSTPRSSAWRRRRSCAESSPTPRSSAESSTPPARPAEPVIAKVFRSLHPGENPDVVVQSALTEAGSTQVPHTVGSVAGEWVDPVRRAGSGSPGVRPAVPPGVEDAWRVALRAATDGDDFNGRPVSWAATAHIHVSLAATLGTIAAGDDVKADLVRIIRSRYDTAVVEVPGSGYEPVVAASLDDLRSRAWPDLQRVHGDYHLGQVLHPDGWSPSTSRASRSARCTSGSPDLALRDVAGMLRSFDYVGGSVELSDPDRSARDWVAASRAAFLEGYAAVTTSTRCIRVRCCAPSSWTRPSTRSSTRSAPAELAGDPAGRHRPARRRVVLTTSGTLRPSGRRCPEGPLPKPSALPGSATSGPLRQRFMEGRNGQPHFRGAPRPRG